MQVGMANSAVQNVNQNVLWTWIATTKIKWCQRGGGASRRITSNRNHDVPELREEAAAANSLNCTYFTRAKATRFTQNNRMMITKNLGMLLLAIYLILVGIMALVHVAIPAIVTGILALAAGILILIGR